MLRQVIHRVGDHAETFARFAGADGFHRCVESYDTGLESDLADFLGGSCRLLERYADTGNASFHSRDRAGQHSRVGECRFHSGAGFAGQSFGFL